MLKKIFISIMLLISPVLVVGAWFMAVLPEEPDNTVLKESRAEDLAYLQNALPPTRGKILAVVTSADSMGESGKYTGYELTELARPYWVFTANGFEVDIASIKGGEPPAVLDTDDMMAFDYAFLNDETAMTKVKNSLKIDQVNSEDYVAIYFAGGKGAMFDFPDNPTVKTLVKEMYQSNKVVSAICHGPAALANVTLDNGEPLLAGKQVSAFTNDEELLLIPDARKVFPFLLEDKLKAEGARFNGGFSYLDQVSVDGNLITGQNPWSTWTASEEVIRALGYTPVKRKITGEENTVELLKTYAQFGYQQAYQDIQTASPEHYDRWLIAMHTIVAVMKFELIDVIQLLRLSTALK